MLDQVNCTFTPHVMGVTVGQEIAIKSADPTFHNVHVMSGQGDADERGRAEPERVADQDLRHGRRVAREVRRASVDELVHWRVRKPLFAVTGDDGTFEIKGVPAGSYKLSIWHEQFGEQEQGIHRRRR